MADWKMRRAKAFIIARAFSACIAAGLTVASVPAEAAAPRETRALSSALRSLASSDRDLAAFYRARNYRPLWLQGTFLSPDAERLLELVSTADLDGLRPDDYGPSRVVAAMEQAQRGSPKALARLEMLLSRTLVNYARDLHRPANVGMSYVDKVLAPSPRPALVTLRAAASAPQPLDAGLGMNPLYTELRQGYSHWRARWASLPQVGIPSGPALSVGARGERVRRLRDRLSLTPGAVFDQSVAAAVREFQATHGLPLTSIADARTVEALNEGPQIHEAKLRLNLQRARALPAGPSRFVLVDAAAQRLSMYENGRVRDSMRVIVGRASEPTPMLAALIRFAVLNPYWNVPPDLVKARIAPAVLKEGVRHLKAARYEVLSDWSDEARLVDPKKVDWRAVAAGRIELPVRQLPGRGNSMGAMKFMFPNDFGVYLHDTPEKKLFGQADRRQSAGCVRLEDAPRLARWLFGAPPATRSAKPEQEVPLPEPVPVYITYLTAAPGPNGIVFRNDIYGRDKAAMRFAGGLNRAAD
ncbi:MAG: L,D-transpeptidase family protein [Pseudomonadota bacterium]|nr:L,D-transpeptidase family protein [Pseudomonadota bacterium]